VRKRSVGRLSLCEKSPANHDALTVTVKSHHGHSACDAIDSGRSACARARAAHTKCGPPLGSPLCEKSQCNHDAIMITVMSHHGHSACDAIVGWQSARAGLAHAKIRPPFGSPLRVSRGNHDAIMITMMNHHLHGLSHGHSACDVIVSWRLALWIACTRTRRGPPLSSPLSEAS